MRSVPAFGVLSLALLSSAAGPKAELQKIYDGLSDAFAKQDSKPYEAVLADDYVLVLKDGKTEKRDAILSDFKKQMSSMHNAVWKRTITKVSKSGDNTIVIVKGHFTGTFGDADKSHSFVNDAVSKDTWTWTKGGDGWKLHKSELVSLKATVDGKPAGNM